MNQVNVALVGCGSVSQRGALPHLMCEDAKEQVHLAAVVDTDATRAEATAKKFGVAQWFTSTERMLELSDVDAVLVITPIQHHFDVAMSSIEARKHVYVQKAMTTTVKEANALIAARDKAGVTVVAAPGFDLFPTTNEVRDIVSSGEIGKVGFGLTYAWGFGHEHEGVRTGSGALDSINPLWYFAKGAGPLPDVTVYSLQLATSILGPVRRVTALANKLIPTRQWRDQVVEIEVEDNAVLLMEFQSGALVTAVGSDTAGSRRNVWGALGLYGTHGAVEIFDVDGATGYPLGYEVYGGGGWGTFGSQVREREVRHALSDHPALTDEHQRIEEAHLYVDILELVDGIRNGRATGATAEQARHVVDIIESAHRSVETGAAELVRSQFSVEA